MKTIKEKIVDYTSKGMTINQAENNVCQEIILDKVSKSPMANNVLIKGGVVMYNITQNLRRTTTDLDFDLIRYDISDSSIKRFIELLNKYNPQYKITCGKIEPLHQEDYRGKRVWTTISDDTSTIKFKLDIGVHTLLGVEQHDYCFYFDNNRVMLKVNPPEQIFAEKIYSLAKHGVLSTRYKDIVDMYYLISQRMLDKKIVRKCLELLILNQTKSIKTLEDICNIISMTFEDERFVELYKASDDRWLDEDYKKMFETILDFIYLI